MIHKAKPYFSKKVRAALEYVQHLANVLSGELAKPRRRPKVLQKNITNELAYGLHLANVATRELACRRIGRQAKADVRRYFKKIFERTCIWAA